MTYTLIRLPTPLNRCLVHVQDGRLKQQERPNFNLVRRRELKDRIWNRKVGPRLFYSIYGWNGDV
jgi:hypothetical protein